MNHLASTKGRRVAHDEIALIARELVLVTLPHKDPGNVPRWTRQNGNITLAIQPGYKDDPQDRKKSVCIGYPYGSIARLILYWIVTETRRTGDPRLVLGNSLATFMRKLGLEPNYGGGPRSSATSVHQQLERLIHAKIRFEQCQTTAGGTGHGWLDMPVAKGGWLWWDTRDAEHTALWESFIVLNDDFFKAILTGPVPVKLMTLLALKKSPLGLDLYAWATMESYKAQRHKQGRFVAWKLLHDQFGSELGRLDHFVTKAKRELRKIMCNCPSIILIFERGGVRVSDGSSPDVSTKAAHATLQPPSVPVKAVPSGMAIEHVMRTMNTRESAVIIAMAFQKAAEGGEIKNTDESYIAFAHQYVI